ncbi:hypothetical protein [Tsukamurella ocularis]|uniref:hypothetical protein n=1 Tax=Tsukamurella ocularis TaxID=1970234 RepID=UPI002169C352|nr:hypothetical protein [Tsukamurella ocularis]MCS3782353.1 hypothetical protein [Tsukamurella ocularis]MCS3789487.1 hypothetical protein [Tsukamurella ocularis]MCS3852634.1 hypothetical protein [Tsukamurella ocularis]
MSPRQPLFASVRKRARDLVVGEHVWHRGEYWRVKSITLLDTTDSIQATVQLDLRNTVGHGRRWTLPADVDVAVRGQRRQQRRRN